MEGASSLLLSTKKKHLFRHKTKKETKQNYPSDRSGMTFRLRVLLADICRTKPDAIDSDSFFLSLKFYFREPLLFGHFLIRLISIENFLLPLLASLHKFGVIVFHL